MKRNENYSEEILKHIRNKQSNEELRKNLEAYHERDIATALDLFDKEDRQRLFQALNNDQLSIILPYTANISLYAEELSVECLSAIISEMDVDDAVNVLDELDEKKRVEINTHLQVEVREDIRLIFSFDEENHLPVQST